MKSTEIEKINREFRRAKKKQEVLERKQEKKKGLTIGDYINDLFSHFYYDENKIYNIRDNEQILGLLEEMKKHIPPKNWENVLSKAVKRTKVKKREEAFKELKSLLS